VAHGPNNNQKGEMKRTNYPFLLVLALACCIAGCGKKKSAKPIDYSQEASIGMIFGKTTNAFGLTQVHLGADGDGYNVPTKIGGQECQMMKPQPDKDSCFLYFTVHPHFKTTNSMNLKASVEYFDATPCEFSIEYDSWKKDGKKEGAYTVSREKIKLTGDQKWKTAQFTLDEARLQGRQNSSADFRLRSERAEFFIRSVTLSRE
jgi:hypothetical protein